ncbi:MAG: DUF899 family protein [Ignavibacteriaceae bacterium]
MDSLQIDKEIKFLQEQIKENREKIVVLRSRRKPEEIEDYVFKTKEGKNISLSEMFGDKNELIVIHNMGKSCRYCTLWADGINGFTDHFENRAGFVVISPDFYEEMNEFAASRNWNFKIYSAKENSFKKDLGYKTEEGFIPGVSVLIKNSDGKILHYSNEEFGPGDDYCSLWHFFELLPNGSDGWAPNYRY